MWIVNRRNGALVAALLVVVVLGGAFGAWRALNADDAVDGRPLPMRIEVRVTETEGLDQRLGRVADRVRHLTLPGADGVLVARTAPALVQGQSDHEETCVLEVDVREGARFGADPDATGLVDVQQPAGSDLVLNEATESRLGERNLREVTIAVGNRRQRFAAAQVVPAVGLARYCGAIVPPGTIASLGQGSPAAEAVGLVWVSFEADATPEDVARSIELIEGEVGADDVEVDEISER